MTDQLLTVTSFSPEGYREYGKKALATMIENWPGRIIVYLDGPVKNYPTLPTNKRIHYKNLMKVAGAQRVTEALGAFKLTCGRIGDNYNYKFNAHRFVRKVFAQCDAAVNYQGTLVWLDADTVIDKPVDEDWIRDQLDEGIKHHFMAYMDRPDWGPCSSFIVWDCSHQQNTPFWTTYYDLIVTGNFLGAPEWHDAFWIGLLINQMGIDAVDIAKGKAGPGPDNVFDKVFEGKARHLKGNLKRVGPQRYQQLIDLVQKLQPENIMEVGTWNGGRAAQMFGVAPKMKYLGFDLFEQATAETDEYEKNVKPHHAAEAVANALGNLGLEATLVAGNTNDSLPGYHEENPDYKADLIYIDAGHAVETIASDLKHSIKMLRAGGVIVMDDYYEGMPEEDLEKWGCNKVLEAFDVHYEVMPIADPVKDGGFTKMVLVRVE